METLPSVVSNNVRIYSVGGSEHEQGLAPWQTTAAQRKRLRKEDAGWARRVTLLQDYGFPEAASRICVSPDGGSVLATGTYKPRLRIYDVAETALRVERHLAAETVALDVLGDDWTRLALLQADRTVEVHAAGGRHASVRLPRPGRAQVYDARRAELLLGLSGEGSLHRLSLSRGSFLSPLPNAAGGSVNALALDRGAHGLVAAACDRGSVSFFDPRVRALVGAVDLHLGGAQDACSDAAAITWSPDGLTWAAGTGAGGVHVHDVRAPGRPAAVLDLGNGSAVVRLSYAGIASGRTALYAADARAIRVYDSCDQSLVTTIEASAPIADFCVCPGGGLVLAALDAPQMGAYYVPSLGPAPRWASYLERVTEEMDESSSSSLTAPGTTIANYRFATRADLQAVGLGHLVGTKATRPYMHGFFVDARLYERARAIAAPDAHGDHVAAVRAAKLSARMASRVSAPGKSGGAAVNADLAARLEEMARAEDRADSAPDDKRRSTKEDRRRERDRAVAQAVLADARFSALFTDASFSRDAPRDE